jgi:hypothetical protein
VQSFAGDGFVSPKNVEVVMTGILTGLRDSEMPVRLESAVAMRTMLKDKTGIFNPLKSKDVFLFANISRRNDSPPHSQHHWM